MQNSLLKIKDKILDELMDDLDQHEGMKLKPKAMVSITAVKPKGELKIGEGDDHMEPDADDLLPSALDDLPRDSNDDDGQPGDDDDDLKMLLNHYMGK